MKKIVSVLLAAFIASFCLLPFSAVGAENVENVPLEGSSVSYSFDAETGTLTLGGSGATPDYNSGETPWNSFRTDITNIVIEEGITAIGDNIFRQCTSLKNVSMPQSLASVGDYAFFHNSALESVSFPSSLKEIGAFAFAACSSLKEISFNDMTANLNLGVCAFVDCQKMTYAQFPVGTVFGQYCVGYLDEDGKTMNGFTLGGLDNTTAEYYAKNASHITFENSLSLTYKIPFGNEFTVYTGADMYKYIPETTGTYHFYSYGDTDVSVALYDSTKTTVLASNDDRSVYDLNFDLTCSLEAGETYYFKVTPYHDTGWYTAYLYPGKITSMTASFPDDFLLYQDKDGTTAIDDAGKEYTYYDITDCYGDITITINYDNGVTDVMNYSTLEYNGGAFSIVDNQKEVHWTDGENSLTLNFGEVSCKIPVNVHEHKFTMTRTEPTCTAQGEEKYECDCGYSYSVPIEPLGHTEPELCWVDPTCEEDGYYYYYCTRCSEHLSETTVLYAIGHHYITNVTKPTVSTGGYTTYTCTNCGYSYTGNYTDPLGRCVTGRVVLMEDPNGSHDHNVGVELCIIDGGNDFYTTTDSDGYFSFYVLDGTYEFKIGNTSRLNRSESCTVDGKDIDLGTYAVICYDLNNDGYINGRDYAMFNIYCNKIESGEEKYFGYLDFNRDGKINDGDMEYFKNFLPAGKLDASVYN